MFDSSAVSVEEDYFVDSYFLFHQSMVPVSQTFKALFPFALIDQYPLQQVFHQTDLSDYTVLK